MIYQEYCDAVLWAEENKVTEGTSADKFSPDMIVTKAQAVTLIARYAKGEAKGNVSPFEDVKEGSYFFRSVIWAVENGVYDIESSGTLFEPNADCTRGHIVMLLYRYFGE